jgi:site-specific recombinase XerC
VAKLKLSTVNAHLTTLDDFYRRRGLGPAQVKRQGVPKAAPRALDERHRIRWLRAAERADPRDRALAHTEFYAGTRGAETLALDLDDVRASAHRGHLIVSYGKGGKYREVPLHPKLRTALEQWQTAATTSIRDGEDIVAVAEILGHGVETARRYSLHTEQDKQRAIERVPVDQ